MGNGANNEEETVVHATGSQEVCVECTCPISRVEVYVRYRDEQRPMLSGKFTSDGNNWTGEGDDKPKAPSEEYWE
jgi:hypothetical protein